MFRVYSTCRHSLGIVVSMKANEVASFFQLGVVREMLRICVLLSSLVLRSSKLSVSILFRCKVL